MGGGEHKAPEVLFGDAEGKDGGVSPGDEIFSTLAERPGSGLKKALIAFGREGIFHMFYPMVAGRARVQKGAELVIQVCHIVPPLNWILG